MRGKADATSDTTATATAGGLRDGLYDVPTYLETNGDPAVAAGSVVTPAVSGPVLACGDAVAGAGTGSSDCTSDTTTTAGGLTRSTGEDSLLSGTTAPVPVAVPVEGFGNGVAGAGDADALADNTVSTKAGDDSYTRGHDSVLSGTVASAAPTGPVDVFGNAVAGAGTAVADATQTADVENTGHIGTTGDSSVGGGNMVTAPLAAPVEGFGNVAGAAGTAEAAASETKTVVADGGGNTNDDSAFLASNNITTPVASAVQAFGNGGGAVAFTDADATSDTEVVAGGVSEAAGYGGLGSGNIGQTPVALPAQLFGNGAGALSRGHQDATNTTAMTAGGDAFTEGKRGVLSGNIVSGPVGTAGQAFGESVAAAGFNKAGAASDTTSTAGGDVETDGTWGVGTGNVVSPQGLVNAQSFAAAASGVGGFNSTGAYSTSDTNSGGDIDTAGDHGFLAGNLVDVPAAAVAHPFGDAVSAVASHSESVADNVSSSSAGGTSTTSSRGGSLSGIDGTVPVGGHAPVYDVPVEVLARAITESSDASEVSVGESAGQLDIPLSGGGMSPTDLPSLTGRSAGRSMPAGDVPFAGVFSGVLDGLTGAGEYHVLPYPMPQSRSDVPFDAVPGGLPVLGDLPAAGDLMDPVAVPPTVRRRCRRADRRPCRRFRAGCPTLRPCWRVCWPSVTSRTSRRRCPPLRRCRAARTRWRWSRLSAVRT